MKGHDALDFREMPTQRSCIDETAWAMWPRWLVANTDITFL